MNNAKAVLLLIMTAAVSVFSVLYCGVAVAFGTVPPAASAPLDSTQSFTSSQTESVKETAPPSSVSPPSSTASSVPETSSSSVVAVGEAHTVSGKIVTRTIDPTAAPLKYNKVYLKNSTGTEINIKTELEAAFSLKIKKSKEPEVLIVHTHATESFMLEDRDYYTKNDLSRTTDTAKNMIAVGEAVAKELTDAGIAVVHDKTLHDYPSYTGSYTASAKTVKEYLKKHPTIKVVLDLHRDAVSMGNSDKAKLVKNIAGKPAAQVMLVMGSQTGSVTNHPNWKQNLRLAMRFHQKMETMYPGLARPILLKSSKYNQNLTTGSMLLEIGTDANTLTEALYSGSLVGKALAAFLSGLK